MCVHTILTFLATTALLFSTTTTNPTGSVWSEIGCECGLRAKQDGADESHSARDYSHDHAWPWMGSIVNVSVFDEPVAYCGATLINNRYVLTAAHCMAEVVNETDGFRVYLGTNDIRFKGHFLNLGIKNVITHPGFDFESGDNDVCLLELSSSVEFTRWVHPVCLKQVGAPFVGRVGVVTGWGSFNITQPTDTRLKEAQVEVVSNEVCAKNYSQLDIPVNNNMICASLPGNDPCKGDSGGPLLLKEGGRFSQIGIISHGEGCSVPDFPSIFSRVELFKDWIIENTRNAMYCKGTF